MRHIALAIAALAASMTCPTLALAASYNILADVSNYSARLAGAGAGDTVTLQPGDYGARGVAWRGLSKRTFNPPLTIVATGASFLGQWYNTDLVGVKIVNGSFPGGFRIDRGADIAFDGPTFLAPQGSTATALMLNGVLRASLRNARFGGYRMGLVATAPDALTIENTSCTAMRSDCVQITRGKNILIDGLDCRMLWTAYPGEHGDCLQGVSVWSLPVASVGWTIRNVEASGAAQGVFLADGYYDRVTISGVKTSLSMVRAVSLDGTNSAVRDVVVSTGQGATAQSNVQLGPQVSRCNISVAAWGTKPAITSPAC